MEWNAYFGMHILECMFWNAYLGIIIMDSNGSCKHKSGFGACDSKVDQLDARPGLGLTFSMLSNIVKSISQPTDVFSNFFPCFLNF